MAVQLEQMGHFRGRVRDLLRLVGLGMTLRNRVVRTLSLLDSPALTWDVEELDRLHRDLKQSFSIEDRYRALDHKLHMIDDNLELLVDLAQQKRSLFLEILVVVLIAIEVVLFVAQIEALRCPRAVASGCARVGSGTSTPKVALALLEGGSVRAEVVAGLGAHARVGRIAVGSRRTAEVGDVDQRVPTP